MYENLTNIEENTIIRGKRMRPRAEINWNYNHTSFSFDTRSLSKATQQRRWDARIYSSSSETRHTHRPNWWLLQWRASLQRSCVSTTCPTTKKCILWNGVFVSEWSWVCINSQVKLLTEVLTCPEFCPQVPHPHVVERNIYSGPGLGIYLHSSYK
jgi:hypothetical protein